MLLRIIHGELKPGTWDAYEKAYIEATHGVPVEGLHGRYLARDLDNPDAGYSVSIWEDEASMRAYEGSALLKDTILPKLTPFFAGHYETHRSEIRHEEPRDIYDQVWPGADS